MEKIDFYYNPMSRGRIAHWMLEEVQANYKIHVLDLKRGEHKNSEFLKINPMGKVPAIVHNGIVVTENAAICSYLADIYPTANMAPAPHHPLRGSYYRWLFFAASCIEPAMADKAFPRKTQPTSSQLGYGSYDDVVNTLEQAVSNNFLVGNHFTAADLYLASNLEWFIFVKSLEAKPVFTSYINRCQDRPGYRRYIEQDGSF